MSDPAETSARTETRTVKYIKSNFCRVIHADGAVGGPVSANTIHMAFYSEHVGIPEAVHFEVDKVKREARTLPEPEGEIVREVEVEVMLSLTLAKSLITWLQDRVRTIEGAGPDKVYRITGEGGGR